MSLASQLHDLRLSIEQFNFNAVLSPEEEQRISHAAAKLAVLLDTVAPSDPTTAAAQAPTAEEEGETLLSIAQQYGIRVADLRKHNAHLKHYADRDPLPKNTPVKIKSSRKGNPVRYAPQPLAASQTPAQSYRQLADAGGVAASPTSSRTGKPSYPANAAGASGGGFAFDTIRSISKEHNVHIDALIRANKVLQKYDVDEPLPQDLDIILPQDAAPAQRTFVLTFAGETLRVIADTVARCRMDDLMAVNPQLAGLSIDARLPEGTRIALPR
jgi:hypothetical protein